MPHDPTHTVPLLVAFAVLGGAFGGDASTRESFANGLVHSIAEVNDPLSHGVVGDGLLSINEAIQLHNRTLLPSQLSLAELMQLGGAGSDIAWVNIDASSVPTITVERDFDVVQDWPHGFLLQGYNGDAEIDFTGPGIQHGFRATSNFASWRNLVIRGGPRGIELQQTDASFGGTVLDHVTFDGQTVAGFVGAGTSANGYGRVLFTRCTFANLPTAATWDESPSGRTSVFVAMDTQVTGVTNGFDLLLGAGGFAALQFERVAIDANVGTLAVRRAAGGDRTVSASFLHVRTRGANGLVVDAHANGATAIDARALDLGASGIALAFGTPGAGVTGTVEDSRLAGSVQLHAAANAPLDGNNLFVSGGVTTLSSTGGAFGLRRSRFVGTNVATTGAVGIGIEDGSVEGGSAQGSTTAPLLLTRCYTTGAIGPHTTSIAPAAALVLSQLAVTPFVATAGGTLQIVSEMPPGFFGLFVLGFTAPTPLLLAPELHVYLDLSTAVTLPGIAFGQQVANVAIPNDPAFWDTDWVAQAAVLAPTGATGPSVHTPPPQRFVIRP